MLQFNTDANGYVKIWLAGDGVPEAAKLPAAKMIAKVSSVTRSLPVAGDLLEPVPGLRLLVQRRYFQLEGDETRIWFDVEVVS